MWGARVQDASIEQKNVTYYLKFTPEKESALFFLFFKIFERTEHGLKLVMVDDNKLHGIAPEIFQKIARSSWFNMALLLLVLANAVITASIKHTHKEVVDKRTLKLYYYIEVNLN
jgi:hypothetical protein